MDLSGKAMQGMFVALVLAAVATAALAADQGHGQSAAERARDVPPGAWQGNWRVTREDDRIRTRGGAELARLHVLQDKGDPNLVVQWVAGPAMCEDPMAGPCEWASAKGESDRASETKGGGMSARLGVSADPSDPFTLRFTKRPLKDEAVPGTLTNAHGDIRWKVWIEKEEE